jgi:hypothetical protein
MFRHFDSSKFVFQKGRKPMSRKISVRRFVTRSLFFEQLGSRKLLAAGYFHPDVNDDGFVDPTDVVGLVNLLNRQEEVPPKNFDVNGDETVSPLDAVMVVNRINVNGNGPAVDLLMAEFEKSHGVQVGTLAEFAKFNYEMSGSGGPEVVPLTVIVNSIITKDDGAMSTRSMDVSSLTLKMGDEIVTPIRNESDGIVNYQADALIDVGLGQITFNGILSPAGTVVSVSVFWEDATMGKQSAVSEDFSVNTPLVQFSFGAPSVVNHGDSDIVEVRYRVPEGCVVDAQPKFTVRNMVTVPGTFPDAVFSQMARVDWYKLADFRAGSIVEGGERSYQFYMLGLKGEGSFTLRGMGIREGNELLEVMMTWYVDSLDNQVVFSDLIPVQ